MKNDGHNENKAYLAEKLFEQLLLPEAFARNFVTTSFLKEIVAALIQSGALSQEQVNTMLDRVGERAEAVFSPTEGESEEDTTRYATIRENQLVQARITIADLKEKLELPN